MSEPVQLAKSARELLAAALNALQSSAPESSELEALAEPIAQAMGIMHRIERSGGQNLEGREAALGHVREALNRLQKLSIADPVVDVLMEHVATSLSKVHALTRVSAPPAPAGAPASAPYQSAAAPFAGPGRAPAAAAGYAAPSGTPPAVPGRAPSTGHEPAPAAFAAQPAGYAPRPPVAPSGHAPPPGAAPPAHAPPAAAAVPPAHAPAAAVPPARAPAAAVPPARAPAAAVPPAPAPVSSSSIVDVELGALTASNFYKGLGGSDVIEHGGIFVATYKIPKIGAAVNLRVRLPGNYEFYASALVQWTREPGGSGDSAEPGFGARFTQITAEGRQLVYRYTRNREPLFYDDL